MNVWYKIVVKCQRSSIPCIPLPTHQPTGQPDYSISRILPHIGACFAGGGVLSKLADMVEAPDSSCEYHQYITDPASRRSRPASVILSQAEPADFPGTNNFVGRGPDSIPSIGCLVKDIVVGLFLLLLVLHEQVFQGRLHVSILLCREAKLAESSDSAGDVTGTNGNVAGTSRMWLVPLFCYVLLCNFYAISVHFCKAPSGRAWCNQETGPQLACDRFGLENICTKCHLARNFPLRKSKRS